MTPFGRFCARVCLTTGAALLTASAPFSVFAGAGRPALSYQLDVSRGKVPTMPTVKRIVDIIASLGYDQFQLYTEHAFAYEGHETVWRSCSPMTPGEIRELDAYCASKGVELVPNQNSFGHFGQWLQYSKYAHLAQSSELRSALCPTNAESAALVASLYDQLLPCFKSRLFNVGCDEVQGVGQGDYLDFLSKIHSLVAERGHTMMFWADIVLEHPETVARVPKDAIALNWGYDAAYDFEKTTSILRRSGLRFYVCPGTSAWCSLVGQTTNMLINVDKAVAAGMKNGAAGYMMTDWGDGGYVQPWIVSVPGIVALADRLKGVRHTPQSLASRVDEVLGFRAGEALAEMGVLDGLVRLRSGNDTILWRMLRKGRKFGKIPETKKDCETGASMERMREVFAAWDLALAKADLKNAPQWAKDDFALLKLLRDALEMRVNGEHERVVEEIRPRYAELWLRQNRPGGLAESMVQNFSETLPAGM